MGCLKLTNISNFHYSITSPLERLGEVLDTERTTLHVMDDTKTVALVETLTFDNGNTPNEVTIRYQYDNHLGSACLELDQNAEIISYEEYHPFGTTSYRSGRTETEVSLKRYKYVGKERDEETGLYYYGARYYAAWLCRFVSVDTLQHDYPHYTPYQYAGNKPISYIDLDGLEETKPKSNNYPPPQLSFPNYPQDQIAKQTPRFNASQQTPTKPSQQYSKLFNIDPKYLQNTTVVKTDWKSNISPEYAKVCNDYYKMEQQKATFLEDAQAVHPVSFGGPGFGDGLARDPNIQAAALGLAVEGAIIPAISKTLGAGAWIIGKMLPSTRLGKAIASFDGVTSLNYTFGKDVIKHSPSLNFTPFGAGNLSYTTDEAIINSVDTYNSLGLGFQIEKGSFKGSINSMSSSYYINQSTMKGFYLSGKIASQPASVGGANQFVGFKGLTSFENPVNIGKTSSLGF